MAQINAYSKAGRFIIALLFLLGCSSFQVVFAQLPWSDSATWTSFGSTKPVVGEDVIIPNGIHILLDEDTPDLGGLTIHGKLEFDYQNLNLTADYIMVMGELEVGTAGSPYTHQAVITLNALNSNQSIMSMGTRGILVMGGSLELHGQPPSVPWTKINASAPVGSTALTLIESVSWSAGDEVIVGPTDFYQAANGASVTQKFDLTSASGTSLGLNASLNAHRWGQLQYATNSGMSLSATGLVTPPSATGFTPTTLDERAPVGNLTRNIVIQAPNDALWNNQGFGAHIMVMRMMANPGVAHLDGVEIRRGGQRGNLGRYPFHWHMLSYEGGATLPDAAGQYIRNSSINESMNRGIVIHGTNGVEVSNNIVYNVRGHGVFTEDASERRNLIDGNLVLHVRNPDSGYGLKIHETGANADRGSSGFWLSNPDNTVTNNMAGDCNTNGFWLAFPEQTFGLSAGISIRPNRLRFGVFENNTAHSNRLEGIMIDWVEQDEAGDILPVRYVSTSDGQEVVWPFSNQERFTIRGLKIWKNGGNGLWDRSHWANNLEFVNADNCFSFFAGSGDIGIIDRSLVVGNSLNHMMNSTDRDDLPYSLPPSAFATYHSTFDMTNNIILNFPEVAGHASGVFSTVDYYIRGVEKGQVRNSNNLIINSHPGIKLTAIEPQYKLAGALWDPNGNWGGNPGDYLVYDDPFFTYGQTPTIVMPNSNISGGVLVEGPFHGFDGFIVNESNYPWDSFMEIQVTRLDNSFNAVGNWSVGEGAPGQLLFNMRHFAAHPDSYYTLEFPTMGEVTDVAVSVTCMTNTTDYQVVGIEYTGDYQVDQIYFTAYASHFGFGFPEQPAGPYKQIYQSVANRQAVVDAPNGQVYWHDTQNDMVWVKIQGGINQYWNPGDHEPNSDEMLYWVSYLRIMGSPAALPVELSSFEAVLQTNETVELFWTTETEINNDHFVVERSVDGIDWQELEMINGQGNSETRQNYSTIDEKPLRGISYYRLKQVDLSGEFTYSSIETIEIYDKHSIKVFPNPTNGNIHLQLGEIYSYIEVEISNAKGQIVKKRPFNSMVDSELNMTDLPAGVYFLKVKTEENSTVLRVLKE